MSHISIASMQQCMEESFESRLQGFMKAGSSEQHWHALDMPKGSAEAVLRSRSVINGSNPVAMIVHPPP